jgi:thiosulfate/3-mercaptopyruvate sulfurtransferase
MSMGPGATFAPKSALLRATSALGISQDRPVITYCNTGHMASVDWFVLHELLGFENVALFDGSMHSWAKQGLPTSLAP